MSKVQYVIDDERTFAFTDADSKIKTLYLRSSAQAMLALVTHWTKFYGPTPYGVEKLVSLWLDHDLGFNQLFNQPDDIDRVVNWLVLVAQCKMPFPAEIVYVHSQNPVGADNIYNKLNPYYNVYRVGLPALVVGD